MPSGIVKTNKASLLKLLGRNAVYSVPRYQREYSWEKDNHEELWDDIFSRLIIGDSEHFLGVVILFKETAQTCSVQRPAGYACYQIVDGQQRLATLTILVRAIIKSLLDCDSVLATELHKKYVICGSSSTPARRLTMSNVDDDFFARVVQPLYGEASDGASKKSHKRIYAALEFYINKIENGRRRKRMNKVDFAKLLIDKISKGLVVAEVFVEDEVEAYTVFETINSRGVDLTVSDLLKNFIYSECQRGLPELTAAKYFETARTNWEEMQAALTDKKVEVSEFVRHFWLSKFEQVREKELFREIRKHYRGKPKAIVGLSANLRAEALNYIRIVSPDDKDAMGEINIGILQQINRLRIKQCYPLLLSLLDQQVSKRKTRLLLKQILSTSVRRSITGENPNEMEKIYAPQAIRIRKEGAAIISQAKQKIATASVDDAKVREALINASTSKRLAKFILEHWEMKKTSKEKVIYRPTIEHIMPQQPAANSLWGMVDKAEYDSFLNRIGNFTLVSKEFNSALQNNDFDEKRKEFQRNTKIAIAKEVGQHRTWSKEQITARGRKIASFVNDEWRVN